MRSSVFVLFLTCMVSDCFGDLVDNLLSKAIAAKAIMQDDSEDDSDGIIQQKINNNRQLTFISNPFYKKKQGKFINPLRAARRIPVLKRSNIFPKELVKTIAISPDGQRVAYLAEEGKNRYIKVVPSQNLNLMSQVIRENYPIVNFTFIGKSLMYTHFDEENNLRAKVQVSLSGKKQLDLPENLKSIRLFKNAKSCLAECYDGERYSLYKINTNNFSCREIKELSGPIQALFDKNLNPLLVMKNENDVVNVYIDSKKKEKNVIGEDEVDMGLEDQMQEVDQIENPGLSQYFSVDNEKNCYKISIQKPQNILVIEKMNPLKETRQEIYRLRGVSSLSQCTVNVEPSGKPSFVTVNSRRYQHYACDPNIKIHLNAISKNFVSWYRINTTMDGKIWLICVVNDRSLDKFYLYDTRTHNLKMVSHVNNSANSYANNSVSSVVKNSYLRPTDCHFLPVSSGEYIQVFLTRGVNSTSRSPLILMMNSSGQYKWEYMPVVQVLANRGYNVLCLNYRKDDIQASDSVENLEGEVTKATTDIASAINWAIKNNIAQAGHVVLLAKKHSILPAMQMFLKNQKVFAGCIAINPSETDLSAIAGFGLDKIAKPTVFIGRFNHSEVISSLMEQISADTSSVISSNNLISQKLMTGIVETFLAEKFNNATIEAVSQADINSLDVMHDGLNIVTASDGNSRISQDEEVDDSEEDLSDQYKSL